MVDFRKALLLLAVLVFATGIASAQQALNCTLNGGAPPFLRAEGLAEEIGQVFITCTGGARTPVGQEVPRINIRMFTNGYAITSRLINYNSTTHSEATLLVDDPAPGNQILLVSNTPPSCLGGAYTPTNCGNTYLAFPVASNNAVEWRNIPFDPPETPGVTRTLRFVNIRVNAASVTGGSVTPNLVPPQVQVYFAISGTFSLPLSGAFWVAGTVQNGLFFQLRNPENTSAFSPQRVTLPQCIQPSVHAFVARFAEQFPNAFRIRGNTAPQNNLLSIYNTESMFHPVGLTQAGIASQATRLRLAFSGIPTGARIYVPSTLQATNGLQLVLVPADGNTAEPVGNPPWWPSAPPSWLTAPYNAAEVFLTNGSGSAVYEVVAANPGLTQNLDVPVFVRYPLPTLPGLGEGTVSGSFAPLSNVTTADFSAPVPRFIQNPTLSFPFEIPPCETRLLFPFVTSIPGWDTGIAIANTSLDPFGTVPQSGECFLNFYGTPGNSSQTSAVIPAGGQLLFAMTQGNAAQNIQALTNFTGYLIARCRFQYAHGYAFISDVGVNRYAQGYVALVIGSGLASRFPRNTAEALGQ